MAIPLIDLRAQHASVRAELDAAIARVIRDGRFIGGPEVERFERSFARFCGVEHCIGTSSGTSALEVGLRAAGVGPGDEVITTAFTFFATVEAILNVGATPVLVDIDPDSALMTVDRVEAAIGERTAAIVVVHLYGQPVDLEGFRALVDRRKLLLVEDAAQAHGASANGQRAGSVGDFATFSFFPGKNLGALGDAGAVTTNDTALERHVRLLRDHGRTDKYTYELVGTSARLDALQAAVLDAKLPHVEAWNEARRVRAAYYDGKFDQLEHIAPIEVAPGRSSAFHLYVVRVRDRDAVVARLGERGIACGVHYGTPLHHQPALEGIVPPVELPNCERLANAVISLPVFPELTAPQQDEIVAAVGGD